MKRRMLRSAILCTVAALTFVAGCAPVYTAPVVYPIEKERTIKKPFDAVWQSAVEWFATHNTPIKNIDKASGLLSTEYDLSMAEAANQIDCGGGDSTFNGKVELEKPIGNFNLLIKKLDDLSTKVSVNVFFTCTVNKYRYENLLSTDYVLVSSEKVNCVSKGTLERAILDHMLSASGPAQAQPEPAHAPPVQVPAQPTQAHTQCTSNEECRAGRVCRGGACTYPACSKDIDCPPSQVCEKSACVAPRPAAPLACSKDTECRGEQICEKGSCVTPKAAAPAPPPVFAQGSPCQNNSQCPGDLFCSSVTHTCAAPSK
jgi:hypothetical protein